MASGLLPKSPVSLSLCDEVPHIFIPKSHLEPREFLISSAKRLLQQYLPLADSCTATNSTNRDRGEPRGSSPPTPPCVRVRTRRFAGLSVGDLSRQRRRLKSIGAHSRLH